MSWPFREIRLIDAGHRAAGDSDSPYWIGVTEAEWEEIKAGAELLGRKSAAFHKLHRAMRFTEQHREEIASLLAAAGEAAPINLNEAQT